MNIKDTFCKWVKIRSVILPLLISLITICSCNYSNTNVESKWLTVIEKELGMPIDSLSSGLTRLKYINSSIDENMFNYNIKVIVTSEDKYLENEFLKLEIYGLKKFVDTTNIKIVDYNEDVLKMIEQHNSDSLQLYKFRILRNDTTGMDLKILGVNI